MSGIKCGELQARCITDVQFMMNLMKGQGFVAMAGETGNHVVTVVDTKTADTTLAKMHGEDQLDANDLDELVSRLTAEGHDYDAEPSWSKVAARDVVIEAGRVTGVDTAEGVTKKIHQAFAAPAYGDACVVIYENTHRDGSKSYDIGLDMALVAKDEKGEVLVRDGELVWKDTALQSKWKKEVLAPLEARQQTQLLEPGLKPSMATDAARKAMEASLTRKKNTAAGTTHAVLSNATATETLKTRAVGGA